MEISLDYNVAAMLLNVVMATANAVVALTSMITLRRYLFAEARRQNKEVFDARSRMYIEFQSRFRDLQARLPSEINSDSFVPRKEHERLIRIYWYMVFDEWFACSIHDDLRPMWRYFSRGVESAFSIKLFRDGFIDFYSSNQSLFGKSEDFFREIEEIWRKRFNSSLEDNRIYPNSQNDLDLEADQCSEA